jgi:hypothetical protein
MTSGERGDDGMNAIDTVYAFRAIAPYKELLASFGFIEEMRRAAAARRTARKEQKSWQIRSRS